MISRFSIIYLFSASLTILCCSGKSFEIIIHNNAMTIPIAQKISNTAWHPNILTIAIVTTGAITGPKYEPANNALEARPFSPFANQNELNTAFEGYIGASPIPNKKRTAYNKP